MVVLVVVLPQTIAATPRLRRGSLVSSRCQRRGLRDVLRHRRHRVIQFAASPVRRGCFYLLDSRVWLRGLGLWTPIDSRAWACEDVAAWVIFEEKVCITYMNYYCSLNFVLEKLQN